LIFGVALAVGWPIVSRIRRLGLDARQSAADEYRTTVNVSGRDEMSALAFAFNEAAADIRRRDADIKDRDDSLRRYIANTSDNVTAPLLALETRFGHINASSSTEITRADADALLADVHTLAMRIQNLSAAATLRMSLQSAARDHLDLERVTERVAARQTPFAAASGVSISVTSLMSTILIADETLVEQAVSNLVDNAIRYNRPGGQVVISLEHTRDGRFSLRVTDDGPGAPDEVLAKLNANRRFRGDEGRDKRSGELGLGLALVREVADRFGIQWAFRKNSRGWFEAELTGKRL
jgi:signal transduction histidine kinase